MVVLQYVRRYATYLTVSLASGTIGWLFHSISPPEAVIARANPALVRVPAGATSSQTDSGTLIAVSSDGNVTLRVEQQPLEWVLEQIAKQSGGTTPTGRDAAARSESSSSVEVARVEPRLNRQEAEQLLRSIQGGSDTDRLQGLMQARSNGLPVAEETLKVLFQSDPSPQVRLIAFETYLEPLSGDNRATRTALEEALYVPNAAIQAEAKKRLDELTESERMDAANPQGGS